MSQMLAVCTTGKADPMVELRRIDIPPLGDDQVRVKVVAAAANPADWKSASIRKVTSVIGCDFAGTVTETGRNVTDSGNFKVGDRVVGFVQGCLELNGAFSEYVTASSSTVIHIPDSWHFESAAQLAACSLTACQALYQSQTPALPSPENPTSTPFDLLVWGGASSAGHFTIQLAKLGGLRVITTASPKHFDRLKNELGLEADRLFDYNDPEVTRKIRAYTNGNLRHAVDCISEGSTPNQVNECMSEEGGTVSTLIPTQSDRPEVKHVVSVAYMLFGKAFDFPFPCEASPGMVEFANKSSRMIEKLVAGGKMVLAPIKVFPDGLAGVQEGLEYMKSGKVSGEKVVFRISDTPELKA
ncbi:hypothetical protein D9758_011743 [Tetrapyrgos nigripes]|uniref:Enoyl reductase (ER) domain-containing protein n=1 Tax=Tetrapyrgos nigripes TaxID=182062 RepID=A0A8H5GD22_9AGAR|nr:hypothetical protein D9758_011743 [Tetrapyrgos nigripes]